METNIKAVHFDIAEKLVDFINKKVEKISRRNESVSKVDVVLTLVKPETAMNKEAAVNLLFRAMVNCSRQKLQTLLKKHLI